MRRGVLLLVLALVLAPACSGDDDHEKAASVTTTTTTSTTTTTVPTTTTSTTLVPAVVGAVGDSLLAQVEAVLPGRLPEMQVHAEGIVGLTSDDDQYAVQRLRDVNPVAAVVVLGTNDARRRSSSGWDLPAIRRTIRNLGDIPCVRWTTVNEASRFEDLNRGAKVINAELRSQAAERDNFGVIEWGAELAEHPEWLQDDGIHHNAEGQQEFADRLAGALRRCVQGVQGVHDTTEGETSTTG